MRAMRTRVASWVAATVLALSAGSAMAGKPVLKKEITGVVNVNTATAQQLDQLPGIGPKAAKLIIELRAKSPFAKVDELRKVRGIGAKKMEKLRPHVTVSGPTTVAIKKVGAGSETESSAVAQGRRATNR